MRSLECKRRDDGFTLIEILVVAVVCVILASIAYPSYVDAVRKSRRAEGRAALMQAMQQQEQYYSLNTRYVAFSAGSGDARANKFKWYSGTDAKSSAYEITASACDGETIENCVVLIAKPGTILVNNSYQDAACGDLMLTSTGITSASGSGSNCW